MRTLPPSQQEEQYNIYEFEDWVPEYLDEVLDADGENILDPTLIPNRLPSTSYRPRWNERTQSWTCDWFDEGGEVIDQGRRLSSNNWLRNPWGDDFNPTPMPSWIAFLELGEEGVECDYEGFGRTHELTELNVQDLYDADLILQPDPDITITIL